MKGRHVGARRVKALVKHQPVRRDHIVAWCAHTANLPSHVALRVGPHGSSQGRIIRRIQHSFFQRAP